MDSKKIAILATVGHVKEFGYLRWIEEFKNSFSMIGDVYLTHTTHHLNEYNILPSLNIIKSNQLKFIESLNEYHFDLDIISKSCTDSIKFLQKKKYDVCMLVSVNQFIEKTNVKSLLNYINSIGDKPFLWQYKKYLIYDKLYSADIKLPWIINLKYENIIIIPDGLIIDNKKYEIKAGFYHFKKSISIIDPGFNITFEELENKINFAKNYSNLESIKGRKVSENYSEKNLINYINKINKKYLPLHKKYDEVYFKNSVGKYLDNNRNAGKQLISLIYRVSKCILRFH